MNRHCLSRNFNDRQLQSVVRNSVDIIVSISVLLAVTVLICARLYVNWLVMLDSIICWYMLMYVVRNKTHFERKIVFYWRNTHTHTHTAINVFQCICPCQQISEITTTLQISAFRSNWLNVRAERIALATL